MCSLSLIYFACDGVDVGLNFPYFIDFIDDYYVLDLLVLRFWARLFMVEIDVGKLQSLFLASGGQQKFRVFIHDARNAMSFIRNPSGNKLSLFSFRFF